MTKAIAGVLSTAYEYNKTAANMVALQEAQATYYATAYPTSTIGVLYAAKTAFTLDPSPANLRALQAAVTAQDAFIAAAFLTAPATPNTVT